MINKIINKFGNNYKKKGADYWFQCPFHQGKSYTSFSVDSQTGLYYCFKCGIKGSVSKMTKEEYKQVKQKEIKQEQEYKQPSYNHDGYVFFKKYIAIRYINPNIINGLSGFNFGYYYNQNKNTNTIKLIINDSASYNYVTDFNNSKIWKGWSKGSVAEPFMTYNSAIFFQNAIKEERKSKKNIYVFEGLEDLLSFIELYNTDIDYSCSVFVCLFGVTNINKIKIKTEHNYFFCLDNDRAGAETIAKYSHLDNIYKVEMAINGKLIKDCKDWNELIVKQKGGQL